MNKVIVPLSLGLLVACASKEPPVEINPDLLRPNTSAPAEESAKPSKSLGKDYTEESVKRMREERKTPGVTGTMPKFVNPGQFGDHGQLDRPNAQ